MISVEYFEVLQSARQGEEQPKLKHYQVEKSNKNNAGKRSNATVVQDSQASYAHKFVRPSQDITLDSQVAFDNASGGMPTGKSRKLRFDMKPQQQPRGKPLARGRSPSKSLPAPRPKVVCGAGIMAILRLLTF